MSSSAAASSVRSVAGRERRCGPGRHLDDRTPLVRVQVGEHPRVATQRVTVGWFHLHHVGAEVGERLAAPSRGNAGSDLDDPQIAQCLSHDVPSSIRPLTLQAACPRPFAARTVATWLRRVDATRAVPDGFTAPLERRDRVDGTAGCSGKADGAHRQVEVPLTQCHGEAASAHPIQHAQLVSSMHVANGPPPVETTATSCLGT